MPETFQALAVFALALLPGALYTWSFEQLVGAWGVRFADRLARFVGVSAVFHVLVGPITYWLWREFILSGRFGQGDIPVLVAIFPILYVGIPIAIGSAVGIGTRNRRRWAKFFTGPAPAPRAWDHLFATNPDGWMLLRLKSGVWLGGAYASGDQGEGSYAAGYPEEQDLYIAEAAEVDPDTGQISYDDDGGPLMRDSGILVNWSEIEYLEFIEA